VGVCCVVGFVWFWGLGVGGLRVVWVPASSRKARRSREFSQWGSKRHPAEDRKNQNQARGGGEPGAVDDLLQGALLAKTGSPVQTIAGGREVGMPRSLEPQGTGVQLQG